MENGLNTLRAVLVALAFLAAIYLAFNGQWLATGILAAGIAAHGAMWIYLYRRSQARELDGPTTPTSA